MRFLKQLALAVLLFGASTAVNGQRLPPGARTEEVSLYARLLAMTDTRHLDTALVARALSSKWQPLRAAATLAIGQIGAEPGLPGAPRLRALLKDSDVTVAGNAAYALGLLRDTAAIADLSAALTASHEIAREAAWALGEIGAPARAAITTGLKTRKDHDASIQLLLAAAKLRPVPLADVEPYLRSEHPSVVWAAAYAIARTRAPGGVRALIDLEASPALSARPLSTDRPADMSAPYTDVASGNQRARAEIARGLAKSAAGDSLGARAFAVLSRLVADVSQRGSLARDLRTDGKAIADLRDARPRCERSNCRRAELRERSLG
jgi:HEAT repeat protein